MVGYLALLPAPPAWTPPAGDCCGTLVVCPYELAVAPEGGPGEALVGGTGTARLSLEYAAAEAAEGASVKVTVDAGGTTSTFEEAPTDADYHVERDLMNVSPGARVRLEATQATARLRWCETICC
jgi:hypothetical protein